MQEIAVAETAGTDRPLAGSAIAADAHRRTPGRRVWTRARMLIGAAFALMAFNLALVAYWSRQPPDFDVSATLAETLPAGGEAVPGAAMVSTTIAVGDTLLGKPGGFLYNDMSPPGVLMDNMPSWECGVMMALRDAVQVLRNDFTRSQSQSAENREVKRADLKLAIDPESWLVPAAENEYRQGVDALRAYYADLATSRNGSARFFPRADNLVAYLALVEKRLGNFGVRLSGSIADPVLTGAVLGTRPATVTDELPEAGRAMSAPERTEAGKVDNVFYCARGYSWAFLHFMRAVAIDFAPVLQGKNADIPVQQIVHDLEGAIKPMRSPIVLNGHGYGLVANHSLVIASYISRVNAAVIDLKILLQQG
jgi:hypothetical protein